MELLFKEGDTFNQNLIDETERNLRKLSFISKATITAVVDSLKQEVSITVEVQEKWSLIPTFSSYGGAGDITVGAKLSEENLLGMGKSSQIEYQYNTFKKSYLSAGFKDPRFFGSHVVLQLSGGVGNDGFNLSSGISYPFYSIGTSWCWDVGSSFQKDTIRLFENGEITNQYTSEITEYRGALTRAFHYDDTIYAMGFACEYNETKFLGSTGLAAGTIPSNRRRILVVPNFSVKTPKYVKEKFFDSLVADEDIELGTFSSLTWQISATALGSDSNFNVIRLELHHKYNFSKKYLFIVSAIENRFEGVGLTNVNASIEVKSYIRVAETNTFVGRLLLDALLKNENNAQLTLGSDSSLRGYTAKRFTGQKRLAVSLEDRFLAFTTKYINTGIVVFSDYGNVWKEDEAINLKELNPSVGIGFRFNSDEFSFPIARIDFGYGITQKTLAISFGAYQYF